MPTNHPQQTRIHARGGKTLFLIIALCIAAAQPAPAEDGLVSSMDMMDAVTAIDGIRVVAAKDIPNKIYTEDYGPAQVLEIIRPEMGPITVGRLTTSCTCISARLPKRTFARGERALIEVRNVKASQPQGATYGVFVQLTSPYRSALQYEMFVKSDRKPGDPVPAIQEAAPSAAPVAAAPEQTVSTLVPGSGQNPGFRYEDIAPYKPKTAEPEKAAVADAAPAATN